MADYGQEPLIPSIPDPNFASTEEVLRAIKEWVEVRQGSLGSGLDRAVTIRDLLNAGVTTPESVGVMFPDGIAPVDLPPPVSEPGVPPTPTNLLASGAVTTILLTFDFARGYSRLSHFEIWRSEDDNIGNAVLIAQSFSTVFPDNVGEGAKYYYWVRAVSDAGTSPFNAVEGTLGETSLNQQQVQDAIDSTLDASAIWDQLTIKTDENGNAVGWGPASTPSEDDGSASLFAVMAPRFIVAPPPGYGLSSSPLFTVQTVPAVVNGVTVPVGVYMSNVYMMNGSITNAKIGNLAVDDAKIANVSVSKLTAGQLAVGEHIESTGFLSGSSGFRINGAGNAEFNNAVVRGTVYASAGSIGGILINATGIQSSNYNGSTAGFRIDAGGTVNFGNGYFRGTVHATSGTFSGSLNAATGTFAGSLSAATGTFRGGVMGGAYTGYAWPPSGQYGFYLGPSGLLMGNYYNNKYVQITSDGNFYAPGMSIVNGTLTINQANVIDTLNLRGEAVTVPRSASAEGTGSRTVTLPHMNAGSAPVFIIASAIGGTQSAVSPPYAFVHIAIKRNGTVLAQRSAYYSAHFESTDAGTVNVSAALVDYPNGPATYTVELSVGSRAYGQVGMTALACKR